MKKSILAVGLILMFLSSSTFAGERLSLGYIYSSSKTHSEIITNTNDSINVVSPTCFDLDLNGRLEINGLINQEFIDEMHVQNIKVTPFLSNHWGQKRAKAALDNPMPLIEDIVTAVNQYNLDGINVDLENLPVSYKEKLTNFVKLLRENLPQDKTVSVAVAANPERKETTWIASYDYKELGIYADYLVLMAYDEHCFGGSEGPVASINFVRSSLENILESVSKDKVILGIPLYGRLWQQGKETGGEAIVIGQVENLIKNYNLVPTFDTETMTPKLTIVIDGLQTNAYVNGKYLEPGTYNIWYENEHSIKTKLKLINDYNLLGSALWALDNEGKEFWDYYKMALNENEYENEKEIRIRQRLESYAKIIKVKPITIKAKIVYEGVKITFGNNIFKQIKFIQEFDYKIKECIVSDCKIKVVKEKKKFPTGTEAMEKMVK